jgi:ribosomal protein S18 acetylase RimI-like enzyme
MEAFVEMRAIVASDREPLLAMLRSIPQFKPDEVLVAEELIDAAIRDPQGSGYECVVGHQLGQLVGYVCFGPTPMTDATWDLYWIAVAPGLQGRGIGKHLYNACADRVRKRGGEQLRIETSSQESYAATGGFYERLGFAIAGRLNDFYSRGDDLLIFYRKI